MTDKVSTSVSLTQKNKEYLDKEVDNRSAFVNDLVEAHRQGKSDMNEAIARYRKEQLESELRTVDSRREQLQDELEYLNERITEKQEMKRQEIEDAKEDLDGTPLIPDNPAVETKAKNIGITPEELIKEVKDDGQ